MRAKVERGEVPPSSRFRLVRSNVGARARSTSLELLDHGVGVLTSGAVRGRIAHIADEARPSSTNPGSTRQA